MHAVTAPLLTSVTYAYKSVGVGVGVSVGVGVAPAGALTVVTDTLRAAGSIASPGAAWCRRRPDCAGLHAAVTPASAASLGMTLTPTPPRVPHVTTLVGTRDALDLTINVSSPTSPVALSTTTLTSAM